VDKTSLKADGQDKIKLSAVAKDAHGQQVKDAKIEFYMVSQPIDRVLAYPEFRTTQRGFKRGFIDLYAKCGNVKSKMIRIMAVKGGIDDIELTADKFNIRPDGIDKVNFHAKAYDLKDNELDVSVTIKANNNILPSRTFSTSTEGVYIIQAEMSGVKSNIIAIGANNQDYNLTLTVDKFMLANNGRDTTSFTVSITDKDNNPVPNAEVELYHNGTEKMNSFQFNTTEAGNHYFYAVYKGVVSNTVKISVYDVNAKTYTGPESDLPVIVIDTNGVSINEKERIPAIMYVYDKGKNKPGDAPDLVVPIGIKLRGQSSLTFPKKQYGIETWDGAGNDFDVPLLGLPEESDWILNGSYADKSLIRNHLAYTLFRQATEYAPRTRFCEVYINECKDIENPYNYMGIYSLIEKIKVDKNRVNIEKLTKDDNDGINVTGGYIVAQDKVKEGEPRIRARQDFTYVYPNYKDMTPQQIDYITRYVIDFTNALFSNDYLDPVKGYKAYLDIKSYARALAMTEFFKAADGMDLSTYYYKPRGEKLHAGPAWDFDLSMGNTDFRTCTSPTGWYCVSLDEIPRRIMTDPEFVALFRSEWKELRRTVLTDQNIDRVIDEALKEIENAKQRSFERWPGQWNGDFVWPNPSGDQYTYTYEEEINRMRKFLHDRAKWIDENIDKFIDLKPVHYDWINEFTFERMNPPSR